MRPRSRPFSAVLPTMPLAAFLSVIGLLSVTPTPGTAQSAAEVLQAMADRYEDRMTGIDNYVVVQEVMGLSTTTYFERNEDGTFTLSSLDGSPAAQRMPVIDHRQMTRVADVSAHEGMETVGGRSAHVIFVEDVEALSESLGGSQQNLEDATMRMWIDEEWLVPLQMRLEGTMTMEGRSGPVTTTVVFEDYREEQGLFHPFTTRITAEGMSELMDISPEQMEEMMRGLEQFQEQMKDMPAAQRAMMERMMGGQIERMQEMVSSGAMDVVVQVTEIRVNEGRPGE
jgi:hypothetical protein